MRTLLCLLVLLGPVLGLHAQGPDADAWMARHFSGKPGVRPDTAADEAFYAEIGLDSLRRNRFIGQVEGTLRPSDGGAPVQFTLWCDTLESILQLRAPGDTTTYAADLRTNTITITTTGTEAGEVNTSVNDLRERVVVNRYRYRDDGSPWRVNRKVPYDRNGGILGQDMQRWTVVKGDTIRFTRFSHGVSPFVDALEWLPYGGEHPFDLLMLLARAGDPMPNVLKCRAGRIDIIWKSMTAGPRPTYRMAPTVEDTRTKTHRVLPIRRGNRRVSVVELDPVFTIPKGKEHLYATGSAGRPDEPEVTYVGTRSRNRVHAKTPCGAPGTVVVRVWVDPKGLVRYAEVDKAASTLRAKACLDNALEAAQQDDFHPIEGGVQWDKGTLTFTYK